MSLHIQKLLKVEVRASMLLTETTLVVRHGNPASAFGLLVVSYQVSRTRKEEEERMLLLGHHILGISKKII